MALTDTAIRAIKKPEKPIKLSDGGGLFLLVTTTGSKLWRMAYRYQARQKTLAFGAYPAVSLATARARRDEAKAVLANGTDPSDKLKRHREAKLAKQCRNVPERRH